jgi:lysophospholipase L1-like esterase
MLLSHAQPVAAASNPNVLSILVLGDSYSAGNGAGDYYGPDECRRSHRNYAEDLAGLVEAAPYRQPATVVNRACSGATTSAFWSTQHKQPPQLASVNSSYNLIFLTIGGNDLYFADMIEYCLINKTAAGNHCLSNLDRALSLLKDGAVKKSVGRVLSDIGEGANPWAKANPAAKIVLVGYPYLEGDPSYTIVDRKQGKNSVAGTSCGQRDGKTNIVRVGYCLKKIEDLGDTVQQDLVNQLNAKYHTSAFVFVKTKDLFAGKQAGFTGPNHELFASHVNPNRWFVQPFVDAQSSVQGTIEALRYGTDVFYHPNPTGWKQEAVKSYVVV